jgi:hypothetical protein
MKILSYSFERVHHWYKNYEEVLSPMFLFGGFFFDAVTLKRVDMLWENIWVGAHLVVVAVAIILLNKEEKKSGEDDAFRFWITNIMQFFFGGLFSTFLVFYFRSATLSVTWPFLLVLALAFLLNESFFKNHYERLVFQIGLLFLSVFSFSIFAVPILLHNIGGRVFIVSGAVALLLIALFLWILRRVSRKDFEHEKNNLRLVIGGVYLAINFLYFTHLIPPLPLALKDGGVYHSVKKNDEGNYELLSERNGWRSILRYYEDFHVKSEDAVYAYSAIFSPNDFNFNIQHEWQRFDPETKEWVTMSVIKLPVKGGREGGFRTYSVQYNLPAGKWRVNVETQAGEVIGRFGFMLRPGLTPSILFTKIGY